MCRRDAQIIDGSFSIPPESVEGALAAATVFLADLGYEDELPDLTVLFRLFGVVAAGRPDRSVSGLQFRGDALDRTRRDVRRPRSPRARRVVVEVARRSRNEWRYDFDGVTLTTSSA